MSRFAIFRPERTLTFCRHQALVFYEYVITLQDEIDMIWRRRWNAATVLFVVNRYLMLLYNAVGLVIPTTFKVSDHPHFRLTPH